MKTNQELAIIFEEFAELMELKGELGFKVIAYQKAARAISDQTSSIEEIYRNGGTRALRKIEAVGEGIADKIEEYIKTNKIKELEKLRKQFPKHEVEYLRVPGIGPATAKLLYQKFGNLSINDLATKLSREGHKVFKDKTLKKILSGIEIYKNLGDRMLLSEAFEAALPIAKYLSEGCGAKKVEAVGSLRRRKDTVGDLDFVATSTNPEDTINRFAKYSGFSKILAKGGAKLSAILIGGREVDLEILPAEKYGSLLLHFTGSKRHNVALRSFAQEKKLSVSEHGIKNEKTGELILCPEERDVYANLGLQFVEPELREDRGEIEAAKSSKLPRLIEPENLKGDLHVHSDWSDGNSSIEEIVKKAKEMKYSYVGISDHTSSLGIARGLNAERFKKRKIEIDRLRKKYQDIKILNTCEANILSDGKLDLDDEALRMFDLVIASVHGNFNQSKSQMTTRIIKAISNSQVKIFGHPTGRLINIRPSYEADWEAVFDAAKTNGVALEINSHPQRLDLPDFLIFDAVKKGVKLAINTDAHSANQLEFSKFGVWTARRGWCEEKDIINSLSYSDLVRWLA